MPPKKRQPTLAAVVNKALDSKKGDSDNVVIGSRRIADVEEEKIKVADMGDVADITGDVEWMVNGSIPYGMVTIVLAEPGVGKSAFVFGGPVKSITTGAKFFDGSPGPKKPGYVLWCDTECGSGITVGRMKKWDLPPKRILVPAPVDDPLRPISLDSDEDLAMIEKIISDYEVRLVVIDSLRGAHGLDENNSKVGQVLKEISAISERTNAAIILIHHSRKLGFGEELTMNCCRGSNAIAAQIRSMIGIEKPDPNSEWLKLKIMKDHFENKPKPFGMRIGASGLEFSSIAPSVPRTETQRDKAEDWLQKNMAPGKWISAKTLTDNAEDDGFSETAVRRARNNLGITKPDNVRKIKAGWEWRLPLPRE